MVLIQNNEPFDAGFIKSLNYKFFVGKLEEKEEIPNARIMGLRLESRFKNLVLGLSRTAQFGGDGRPSGFSTIKDIIIGNDNTGNKDKDPSNQLAAIDFEYKFIKNHVKFYGQTLTQTKMSQDICHLELSTISGSTSIYHSITEKLL